MNAAREATIAILTDLQQAATIAIASGGKAALGGIAAQAILSAILIALRDHQVEPEQLVAELKKLAPNLPSFDEIRARAQREIDAEKTGGKK